LSHAHNRSVTAGSRIILLGPTDLDRWDEFVRNHPLGTVCHGSAWRQVLEDAFPHVTGHFLALEEPDTRRIVAGLPVYSLKSWLLGNRLVCVPFAAWCDPLANNDRELELLLGAAKELQAKNSGRFTEVRVRHTAGLVKAAGLIPSRRWLHHSVALDRPREELWRNLSRTAVRQLVRSAEKSGVEILREEGPEAIGAFHHILSGTRRRLGLPPIPVHFFQALHRHLKTDGLALLLARQDGALQGGVLATKSKTSFHLEYAAVASAQIAKGTMQLLYWRAMEMAQNEGCGEFTFGRTDTNNAGLVAYKRHWGCVEEHLWEFRTHAKPFSELETRGGFVAGLANKLFRNMPDPLLRLAGAFIYRHR